ncbi:MAG: LytTR family DNA-binding domain-containing protein [Oscillospiraceae bacterium]|nr:LytTR family DNA-binding domain-containing protein [Oscillospiraceae bacterium]
MEIIICEDIKENAEKLSSYVTRYFSNIEVPVEISVYENGDDFLVDFNAGKFRDLKIVFLDIYMPGTLGVDVAREIRKINTDVIIIFTTTSRSHGLDSYYVKALQYLIKPLDYSAVEAVLNDSMVLLNDLLQSINVLSDGKHIKVYLKDILFAEMINNDLLIHTVFNTVKSPVSLHEFEKQVEGKSFLRTHKNYVVNMSYINDITANNFIIASEATIPICEDDEKNIKQAYRDYLTALSENM